MRTRRWLTLGSMIVASVVVNSACSQNAAPGGGTTAATATGAGAHGGGQPTGAATTGGTTTAGGTTAGAAGGGAITGGTGGSSGGATGNPDASVVPGDGGANLGDGGSPSVDIPPITVGGGLLKLQVCADDVIRVAYAKDAAFFSRPSLATAPKKCVATAFTVANETGRTTVTTAKLKARVDLATGVVTFLDLTDQPILTEKAGGGRTLTAATAQGETASHIQQEWQPNDGESLYGLGQHQQGLLDIKGYDLDLKQYNTEIFIPFLVSSRGYGLLWDNTSFTRFGDLRQPEKVPGVTYDANNFLTGVETGSVTWQGQVLAPATGDYLFYTFASGDLKVDIAGTRVIDHWRQGWLPNTEVVKVRFTAGQSYPIKVQWSSDIAVNVLSLMWKTPAAASTTSLWSEVGDGVDYYFVYGPDLDHVVAGYRRLTGEAPMMPKWAYGMWQCRERYKSSQEITDVLAGFRSRNIPVDNIVQDWQYWKADQWGSHEFDTTRFPDAATWIKSLHDTYHAHLMISVWPKFYTSATNYTELNSKGFLYKLNVQEGLKDFVGYPFTFYDAFSPDARKLFWSQMNTALFAKGVDAWWLDATEPDLVEGPFPSSQKHLDVLRSHMHPTAMGTGGRMLNAFSLVNSQAVYEGQRSAAPGQRVFILTRNGFAGQQRYAAASWSGDITSTWTAFKKQIPAGLGFSISGMPYWTTDTGGFAVPTRFAATPPTAADTEEWRELTARWYQYSTFVPLLRVHGQAPFREMWEFGGDTSPSYLAQLKFDRLRYRLLPYIYSLAGGVTQDAGTIMRPLVMDFRADTGSRAVLDQYMFGPAFLVNPVTTYQARTRSVYLPPTTGGWYDFWSGTNSNGGQTIMAPAPYDAMPVFVRAGSIVPLGPELMYTTEKPAETITLYVYAGADGAFTLYEDEGLNYNYEQGAMSRIPITYTEATKTLTIGKRQGTFTGMLMQRTFQVVLVTKTKAAGFSFTPVADKSIAYTGEAATATF